MANLKQLEDMALDLHSKAQRGEVTYGVELTEFLIHALGTVRDRLTTFACRECGRDLRSWGEIPHICHVRRDAGEAPRGPR